MDRPGHILVVEDDRINAALLTAQVQKLGHSCRLAADGDEAVAVFAAHTFDLVLLDLKLRSVSGFDAIRGIRRVEAERGSPTTPVVAVTAYATVDFRERCLAAGFDDFIPSRTA
jgi:two-component system sensor histidine kinase EvgS